jgi:OOP family OmpA-OmpF porin
MAQVKNMAVGLLVAGFALAGQTAHAQQAPATASIGNAYVGLGAGAIIPQNIDLTFSGALSGSAKGEFKTGWDINGFAGYHVNDYLAGELDLDYGSFDYDKITGNVTGVAINAPISGSVDSFLGIANLVATPLGRAGFSPYIGGGVGLAHFDATVNSVGGVAVGSSSSDTDFAADIVVGLDVPLSNRLSLGARYRFLWVNSGSTTTSDGVTTKEGNLTAHLMTANATFRF